MLRRGQGRTRVCSSLRAPPVEEHVRRGRLHARGVNGRHVRVVEAVPGALPVAAVRRVVPAAVPAVVVADGVQVVHGRHRLRLGVGFKGIMSAHWVYGRRIGARECMHAVLAQPRTPRPHFLTCHEAGGAPVRSVRGRARPARLLCAGGPGAEARRERLPNPIQMHTKPGAPQCPQVSWCPLAQRQNHHAQGTQLCSCGL